MKLTNQEIIDIANALKTLGEKELPIKITYLIIDNFDKLVQANSSYVKALEKAKSEDEIKELLDMEREVDLEPLKKQELIDSGTTLTPNQLSTLKRLIDG